MKKTWLIVALAALVGTAVSSMADVQNIRLSGDLRIRGYYLQNTAGDAVEDQIDADDNFISQRTRVTVEADLEDHVMVVVTLQAEGMWGQDNATNSGSGAGYANAGAGSTDNRSWDTGVTEAYVQINEMFYQPLTLKVGRQFLNYGRGLIISSNEQEYNYDSARLVWDAYPLTIDALYAKMVSNTSFGPGTSATTDSRDIDMLFVNARYEFSDSAIKDIEAYFGYVINNNTSGGGATNPSRVPPIGAGLGNSPMIVGLRADITPAESLVLWAEGAFEFGSATTGDNIEAWLANAGGKFTMKDTKWTPVINGNFTFASGGYDSTGAANKNAFVPWFDYVEGYNGYLFAPLLSNIIICNLGVSVKPSAQSTVSLQGYYYYAVDTVPGNPGVGIISNKNIDFGGLGYSPSGSSHNLGYEVDLISSYDYSKDVRFQIVNAFFIPDHAFTVYPSDMVAHEVRGEVSVRF